MQGGWAQRQGRDLHADGSGVGRHSRGIGRLISATHGVVDEHADNCINTSTSASTNTVKNASASSAIVEQNDDGIHSARAKVGAAMTIAKARRRPAASRVATAPAPPTLLLPQGGWHVRTSATAMATTTKTKSEGRRRNNNRQGQEEAGCVARGRRPRPRLARLTVAMGTTACKDIGNGDNDKDKDGDKDGNRNKDKVATKTTMRQRQGQRQRQQRRRRSGHP